MNIVVCFKNLNDNQNDLTLSKLSIIIKPNILNSWGAAGWSAYDLGKYSEADTFFESALGCDMHCPDALFGKASVMKVIGKDYSYYQKALTEIDPEIII